MNSLNKTLTRRSEHEQLNKTLTRHSEHEQSK